jgi:hypothetical protein
MPALHQNNIRAGFADTGIVPFDPNHVLAQLHTEFQTPSPRPPSNGFWAAETPYHIAELPKQAALIRRYIQQRSPPSPTEQAISQLVKGATWPCMCCAACSRK